MTKVEYIDVLRKELRKMPPEEIEAAIEFYEEMFSDAAEAADDPDLPMEEAMARRREAEENLAAELGDPKKAARQIKAEYASKLFDEEEYETARPKPPAKRKWTAIWWILLGVSAPISVPLAFALIVVTAALVLAMFAVVAALMITGVALFGAGIFALTAAVSTGIMMIGIGLTGIALAAALGCLLVLGIRAVISSLARSVRNMSEKRRARREAEYESEVTY